MVSNSQYALPPQSSPQKNCRSEVAVMHKTKLKCSQTFHRTIIGGGAPPPTRPTPNYRSVEGLARETSSNGPSSENFLAAGGFFERNT